MLQTGLTAAQLAEKEFHEKYTSEEINKFGNILKFVETQRSDAVALMGEAERNRYHEFVQDALNVERIFYSTLKGDSRRSVVQKPVQNPAPITLDLEADNACSDASDDDDNREKLVHSDPGVRREKLK